MTSLYLKNYLGIRGNQEDLQISMAVWLSLDQLAAHEEKRQQKEREDEKTSKTGRNGRERNRGKRRREKREQKRTETERTLFMASLNIHHSFDKPSKAKQQLLVNRIGYYPSAQQLGWSVCDLQSLIHLNPCSHGLCLQALN